MSQIIDFASLAEQDFQAVKYCFRFKEIKSQPSLHSSRQMEILGQDQVQDIFECQKKIPPPPRNTAEIKVNVTLGRHFSIYFPAS